MIDLKTSISCRLQFSLHIYNINCKRFWYSNIHFILSLSIISKHEYDFIQVDPCVHTLAPFQRLVSNILLPLQSWIFRSKQKIIYLDYFWNQSIVPSRLKKQITLRTTTSRCCFSIVHFLQSYDMKILFIFYRLCTFSDTM